jgi:two-component system cell cycle sensor histidine kinase/response regulator CckA
MQKPATPVRFRFGSSRPELFLPLALLLLILTGIFSVQSWRQSIATTRDVRLSTNILDHSRNLLTALGDAETGQRGFLLTGREQYLQPFHRGEEQTPAEVASLQRAVRSLPEQRARAEALGPLVTKKLDELRLTVGLRRSSGIDAALAVVNTDAGKRTMDEIRKLCLQIENSEYSRLVGDAHAAERSGQQSILFTVAGNVSLFVLLALAMVVINWETRQRDQLIGDLHERRELLQTTLASIGDAVIVTDDKGDIAFLNRVAQALTGWEHRDAVGKPLRQVFSLANEHTGEIVESPIDEVLREGHIVGMAKHTVLLAKDGHRVPIDDSGAPIRAANGSISGVVIVFRDVTETRRAESERRRIEERLQDTAKLQTLGVLAGGIAHDFNNLLAVIMGNAALALEMSTLTEAGPLIREVVLASERAAHLTRQMLAYSGKGKFVVEQMDLSDYVRQARPRLQDSIPLTVQLNVEFPGKLSLIEADPSQVQQILMNLVLNAAEAYEGRTGTVTVAVFEQQVDRQYLEEISPLTEIAVGDYVCLEVRDCGPGMDRATLSKIFDPFFSTKFTGRGLGLPAVVGLVRGHKGALRVYSESGQGATFRVLFPAVAAPTGEPAAQSITAPWRGESTILVVDGNEGVMQLMKNTLNRLGYRVLLAEDGEVAIGILKNTEERISPEPISLMILDMTVLAKSGEQTLCEIRQLQIPTPVLISSGFSEADVLPRFEKYGVAGFVPKPFTVDQLAERVGVALAGPHGSNALPYT